MKVASLLFLFGICCFKVTWADFDSGAIQIAAPINHTFHLHADELKPILENENIKDRHIVVVSIAGAYREGKSFLLNFFLKYLYAQYKKHDVSDWIGETTENSELSGFKWRAGRKRETVGIWMWSEIFTHDYENGDKVAILLLDTQGIFDDQSSVRDCTTIFALSMMLSSVQCYNLKENIKEDDLQHLELFTEYGRLALEQSSAKPFQELLFIVRDWPFAYETEYGWSGQKIIEETLAGNDDQTPEMRQLRERIQTSFENITAFLMPHPGMIVARGNSFTGEIKQIDADFIKYVKELVPGLLAPENLLQKKINGQNVRARDLLQYLEAYIKIFNGDSIPEPRSVLMATAEAGILIMQKDALNSYVESVQKSLNEVEYFKDADFDNVHQTTKTSVIEQFKNKPKLGGEQLATTFQQKLESDIEEKYVFFKSTNEEKRKNFIEKANLHNEKISIEIKTTFEQKIVAELEKITTAINYPELNGFITTEIQTAIQDFDAKKMGDDDVSKSFRDSLEQELNGINSAIAKVSKAYHKYLTSYVDAIKKAIDEKNPFFEQSELIKMHQNMKQEHLTQFSEAGKDVGPQMLIIFQKNIDSQIEQKFTEVGQQNDQKRKEFINSANNHNENLVREIKANFESKMQNTIGTSYLQGSAFVTLFMTSKTDALNEFGAKKMGDDQISNSFREKLERELDSLQTGLSAKNEANKPPEPVREIHHHHHDGSDCIVM